MDKLEKIVSHSRDGVGPMRTERHHLICSLFEEYIEMYASRDDRLTSHFSDNFSGYAGSSDVLITDKAEWLRITRQDFAQIPERIDIEMLDLSLQDLAEDIVVVTAFFYIHLPIPEDILSNETARLALVFRHEKTAWKIVHSGISLPYGLAHDDEIYPMSRLEKRNLELEEIINVRTGELKRSEALFREMFDNMKTGVAIYEAVDNGNDFLFKDLNPSGCNQAQVEQKDIINKSVKTVFPGIVDLGLFDVFQRVWQTGEPELQSSSVYNDKRIELWVENYVYKLTSGEIVAVYDDISKRKESERKQAFLQKRLEALWKLSSMLDADLDSICDTILEEIVEMTESQYGFFGFIDDDEQILKLYSWSNKVLADCAISHKQIELPIENSGIWGNAVRDRKPFILNEYQQDCPNKKGLPDGHVPLSRIMSIPVLISNKIVAVAVVANKESDYSNNDTKQIVAFLTNAHIILERKQKELSIIQAKEEWQRSFDAITDIVTIQDRDMRIVRANKAAHSLFEVPLGELVGRRCYEVFRDITEPCLGCPMIETIQDIKSHSEIIHHENLGKTFLVSSAQIDELNGNDSYLVHIAKDITEQKRLEESLFQSHKMEAIGTLAGGIAHDFNNILSAILGYSQIVKEDLPVGSPIEKDIDMVIQSGKRAADLVKQILTFSRKKEHHLQTLTPHPIIKEALQMLQSTLPATVEIKEDIDRECGKIEADPTNIHQIVVNLCSNALHAMEQQKGTLTVKLSREDINAEDVEAYDHVAAGAFVVLSVSDTGQGIDKKNMQRVFEPYFTTKEVGKGSGIGLAVIHGIVQDCKGFIRVESTVGQGSTFHIYLPALKETFTKGDDQATFQKSKVPLSKGCGGLLIVDDEKFLVQLNKRRLEYAGYIVTATTDSEDALEKIRAHPEQFDLLITDQTMPNMSGVELTHEVHKIKPDMLVIMSTGHSDLVTKEEALKMGISKYVVKPIQGNELIDAVGELLDEK